MKRPHWSYSRLAQYLRCPLQYYFERVLHLPRPFISSGLLLGSAVHEALAEYHRSLQQGRPIEPHQIGDAFLTTWKRRGEHEQIQLRTDETTTGLIEQGLGLIEVYLAAPPPTAILSVEQSLTVPLMNGSNEYLDRPLVTIQDLLCEEDNQLTVVELKTSSRRYSQAEVDTSLQASCYAGAAATYFGRTVKVRYRVMVKNKTPLLQELSTTRDETDYRRVGEIASQVGQAVQSDIFYPNESPMNCSTCPYRSPCRDWSRSNLEPTAAQCVQLSSEVAAC